jgi:Fe-S-cluster-containing dehydrogenase component/DMSO reductase anchor subunit
LTARSRFRILEGEVAAPAIRLSVLNVLQEQRTLTAVERFAQRHAANDVPDARIYEDLIPLSKPGPGQQYGFRVDLDVCTGCKACVAACHSLNGLDDDEAWRTVGLLHGGSSNAPVQQTVTTACHHCLDPACMNGCPVKAYEKDPVTGIVRHLDDQCIGCQYCVLTCPYEVPRFNKQRGIVRKCDMCSDRLSAGEAPACVQSCPNQAISIQIVDKTRALEDAQAGFTMPGAPSPGVTVPTTEYVTKRAVPKNLLPADYHQVRTQHPHMPLVFLLVLTQLSVGAFVIEFLLRRLAPAFGWSLGLEPARATHALVALGAGLLALAASIFHLGRPQYAFRAVLGIRTSWMSREILAFGAFAGSAALYAAFIWREAIFRLLRIPMPSGHLFGAATEQVLGGVVVASGLVGVFCSVMIYVKTAREWWSGARTAFRFFASAAVLGLATTILCLVAFGGGNDTTRRAVVGLAPLLVFATLAKLLWEVAIFTHLADKQLGPLRRTALLLKGDLRRELGARLALGFAGGCFAPLVLASYGEGGPLGPAALVVATLGFAVLVAAELVERALFFRASSPARMPGSLA